MHLQGGRLLTTDPEQLLRNGWRLCVEASDFEAFCNAKWWILFAGAPALEKNIIARANLVPVPNRALEFKIPKTPRKQGEVPITLTNQR